MANSKLTYEQQQINIQKARKSSIKVISKHGKVSRKRAEEIFERLKYQISPNPNGEPVEYLNVEWCEELQKVIISGAGPCQ